MSTAKKKKKKPPPTTAIKNQACKKQLQLQVNGRPLK
jgi:hypothetical protein